MTITSPRRNSAEFDANPGGSDIAVSGERAAGLTLTELPRSDPRDGGGLPEIALEVLSCGSYRGAGQPKPAWSTSGLRDFGAGRDGSSCGGGGVADVTVGVAGCESHLGGRPVTAGEAGPAAHPP